jgi:peroxiredoxin
MPVRTPGDEAPERSAATTQPRGRLERIPLWVPRTLNVVLWLVVFVLLYQRFGSQVAAALGLWPDPEPAPALALTTLDGERVSLADYRGKVVLLNFWATWCAPCRVEMPGFQRVWEERRGQGFVVLGISTDRTSADVVRRFVAEGGYTYPMAMATPEATTAFGGARTLPLSILVDRLGRIRHRVEGYYAEPALRLAVDRLLRE